MGVNDPKRCPRCGELKPLDLFYGSDTYCKECRKSLSRDWQRRNWKKSSLQKRLRRYRLTMAQFGALLTRSDGKCESCGVEFPEEPNIEHNHASGKVRGLVCRRCNYAIAVLEDPLLVDNVRSFLERFGGDDE